MGGSVHQIGLKCKEVTELINVVIAAVVDYREREGRLRLAATKKNSFRSMEVDDELTEEIDGKEEVQPSQGHELGDNSP